jgi:small-conductance mechanosensitive channel
MRWYVNIGGETVGPVEEPTVVEMAKAGKLVGASLRDEQSGNWIGFDKSPFGALAPGGAADSGSEALGILLLILPFVAGVLVWLLVVDMNLLQKPDSTLWGIMLVTVGITAVLMGVEASQLGMGSRKDSKGKMGSGPVAWFLAGCLLWIIALPAYLYSRSKYGRKNMVVGGLLVALFFLGSVFLMGTAIEQKKTEVRRSLQNIQLGGF